MAIRHFEVDSSSIKSFGYNPNNRVLEIVFVSSPESIYCFENVPANVVLEFMNATSVGSYFAANIKAQYPKDLEEDCPFSGCTREYRHKGAHIISKN